MNNRTLIIIASILFVGIATNWLIGVTEENARPEEGPGNEPDLYIEGARITQFNSNGLMERRLMADRMTHFPLTDVTTLAVPNVLLYADEGQGEPWDIISTQGRLLPESMFSDEVFELWDQVLATREDPAGDFIHIQTESLTVFPERDFAATDAPVSIDNARGRTTAGGGMKAWLDSGRVEFFSARDARVVTVLSPGSLTREPTP